MTEIFIHGKLGRKFGRKFKFAISRPKDAIAAIETIHEGFSKELIDLGKEGQQYSIIVDDNVLISPEEFIGKRKIKRIEIVPAIFGSGAIAYFVVSAVAYIASVYAPAYLSTLLVAIAVTALSYGITALLTKPPKENDISASTSTVGATSKSFLFTNKENLKQQGSPVPIGYGRLRIGSSVIQEVVKSYPNSISTFDEFVGQTTQEGDSSMSIINNQQT